MFGLQPTHWLVIIIVAILFFVPSRLPEVVRALGQTIKEMRNSFKEIGRDTRTESHHNIDLKK